MHKQIVVLALAGASLVVVGAATSRSRSGTPTQSATREFVVRDVRVFDGEKVIPKANVHVRDGVIVSVGAAAPDGIESIAGDGRTLLPGLIDSHTHAFADALERALTYGVTTELDMFTSHQLAAAMRLEQQKEGGALRRADLFSAGTLVTSPKGHGTEYSLPIPTLASAADAQAFIDARIAEGSDYIKIVYDDGSAYGMQMPTIDRRVLAAAVSAARTRGKLAVVHIGSRRGAAEALEAGASGLVHIFADAPADSVLVERVLEAKAFVIPTLSVTESTTGVASGAVLLDDDNLRPFVTAAEQTALGGRFPARPGSKQNLANALAATKLLHDAGVPILAGTDAPNPGTAHGASIHRELELLVRAGLTPVAALTAATATPARIFPIGNRGRIAAGQRADLLLVNGDPTADITATRDIAVIWKYGVRVERTTAPATSGTTAPATTDGVVSRFDSAPVASAFGSGWQISTDSLLGGTSTATMTLVKAGANGTSGALEVSGRLDAGSAYPWAGAMYFPGPAPMAPANLSQFKEIVFWARGVAREHQLMIFTSRLGNIPATRPFAVDAEWKEFVMPLSSFSGIDGSDLRGVLFSAGPALGPFQFAIDEVRFR